MPATVFEILPDDGDLVGEFLLFSNVYAGKRLPAESQYGVIW